MGGVRQNSGHSGGSDPARDSRPAGAATTRWEHFQHVADVGLRGFGATPAGAFEQAAVALTAVLTDPRSVRGKRAVTVRCVAPDLEILLVDWLNALVFEMATRRMLFSRFEVSLQQQSGEWRLDGRAWGEPMDPRQHRPATEVKGATLSELEVRQTRDGLWRAQCIVDV